MITDQQITWAYRLLLGREPENEAAVKNLRSVKDINELRSIFLNSAEYRAKSPVPYLPLDVPPMRIEWQTDERTAQLLLSRVQKTWNQLGQERPHWSVLSSDEFLPEAMHGQRKSLFFESGAHDLRLLLATLARLGVLPSQFPRVFEFGCGLARVTLHLAAHFAQVSACDVSPSHLRQAETILAARPAGNVRLELATVPDFGMIEPFNLWFSRIVLQHNSPPLIAMILRRALELLEPGGMAIFQVPTYGYGYRFHLADYLRKPSGADPFEMHVLPQLAVFEIAHDHDCVVQEVREDNSAGSSDWISNWIVLRKTKSKDTGRKGPPP